MIWRRPRRFPLVLQSEAAECGLACLVSIAAYFGAHISLAEARRRFAPSLRGATLTDLVRIAGGLHLVARALRVDLDGVGALELPCILHWDMDHFVVLCSLDRRRATIADPASGQRRVGYSELSDCFTGVALELGPAPGFAKVDRRSRASLAGFVRPPKGIKRTIAALALISLALEAASLAGPPLLQWVIDVVIPSKGGGLLASAGCGFVLLAVLSAALGASRGRLTAALSTRIGVEWRTRLACHLLRLPLPWFERRWIGDIMTRFDSSEAIRHAVTSGLLDTALDGFMAMAMLIAIFWYSAALGAVVLADAAGHLAFREFAHGRHRELAADEIAKAGREKAHMVETLRGVQSVKLLGMEAQRQAQWLNLLVDSANAEAAASAFLADVLSVGSAVQGVAAALVIWIGSAMVMRGSLSVGMLVAVLAYREQFLSRSGSLVDKAFGFRVLGAQADRLADITEAEPEQEPPASVVKLAASAPLVSARSVSFRYSANDPWVLRDLDLDLDAGECVAITGRSGCGKSTLAKIVAGLLVPTSGAVLVGGTTPAACRLGGSFRLGVVLQDDTLFSGTIADNVAGFASEVEWRRVERCCDRAALGEVIVKLPMGLRTLVGEGGAAVSGGEKQRILLARALYRDPQLLILDEATSHLDTATASKVLLALRGSGAARLMISHDAGQAIGADRVVDLEGRFQAASFGGPSPEKGVQSPRF